MTTRRLLASLALGAASLGGAAARAQAPAPSALPDREYLVLVASEGNDRVSLVRFGPRGARVDHSVRVGANPTELVGPHGLAVAPDGQRYFVSTAHGAPFGSLVAYSTAGDTVVGRVRLGPFPATVSVSPDGAYVWVANFNLHGDMVPSSVSVVYAPQMVEIARIPTCTMPHGSRLSPDGRRHYSVCMMDDELVEIDAARMAVARRLAIPKAAGKSAPCAPTWAQPSADGRRVWVACNRSNEIAEVDVASWALVRRLPAGDGVYNLAATHDGRLLLATNKRTQSVSLIETSSGRELARIPTTRRLPSGVAVSADDRWAFVTCEGVGAEPGTVDVIDLRAMAKVASVDVGQQAGGIDVLGAEPAR